MALSARHHGGRPLPLYHGYLHRIRRGVSPVFTIIRSADAPGRAVVAISIVLVAQFSLLGLSDFRPTAHFGMLCAVGLFAGQLFELLLMPALLGLRLPRPKAVKASSAGARRTRR